MNRGLKKRECPELWNLEHPDRVAGIPSQYVEADSQVVLTNTFGANRFIL